MELQYIYIGVPCDIFSDGEKKVLDDNGRQYNTLEHMHPKL